MFLFWSTVNLILVRASQHNLTLYEAQINYTTGMWLSGKDLCKALSMKDTTLYI
jgi:hypothetical protein